MVGDSTIAIVVAISLFLIPSSTSKSLVEDQKQNNDFLIHNNNNDNSPKLIKQIKFRRIMDWETAVTIHWGSSYINWWRLSLSQCFYRNRIRYLDI
jgi:hypothetical protein